MTPQLRGMVVTTAIEGAMTYSYVNVTFVVPETDAASVDLGRAFHDLATMFEAGKIKERAVALRREFIQPI